jgi:CheY-like chemotaxis protein
MSVPLDLGFENRLTMNILIAEDNPVIRMINSELMDDWGFSYDMASNGEDAVRYAVSNSGKYDLCLMDIEMPEMDGIAAARAIRKQAPFFPIVALTSNSNYKMTCLDAGMDDFIEKPCDPLHLRKIISEITVKSISVSHSAVNIVAIREVTPVNHDELQELRALKNKGLTKLKMVGAGHVFIVHKNIQNKISHDLIAECKELSEFIDRSPHEPGRCHLYKANLHITKDLFLPEELDEAMRREDEIAMRFLAPADRRSSD